MTATPEQLAGAIGARIFVELTGDDPEQDSNFAQYLAEQLVGSEPIRTLLADLAAALRERDEAVTARKALVDQLPPLLAERDTLRADYISLARDIDVVIEERDALRVRAETAEAVAATAGDMWNEVENCRELWESTDRAPLVEEYIARYERAAHAAAVEGRP